MSSRSDTTRGSTSAIRPERLRCEYLPDPAVVDVERPRLSWIDVCADGERGQVQTAWQIRVAGSADALPDAELWDSGKVASDSCDRIEYAGQRLDSRQECWWQVRVWDRDDRASDWSEPGFWRMGLLSPDEWKASWIGAPWQGEDPLPRPKGPGDRPDEFGPPAPLLRTEFTLGKEVAKAVVFATGLGYFELYVNGSKVGDDELVPNQTNYDLRPDLPQALISLPDEFTDYTVMYLAYDVRELLTQGANAIGGILGNGFYNPAKYWAGGYGTPRLLAQLHVEYADGSEEVIATDESWQASKSAILMDMVYYGETYDAREEQPGWCRPDFDDSSWEPAALRKPPHGRLVAHTAHADRVTKSIEPVSITKKDDGTWVVDFGVEISGRLRFSDVTAPAGHRMEIGYVCNTYSGDNSYVFRGGAPESYASRFNWFVFRSVEISGWPGELRSQQVRAEMVNTETEESAHFETSNPLFNEINEIWKRSQLDNMHGGIASDCPHRERSPYTGDGQVACVTVMHNFDARTFYYKWIADVRASQIRSTGYVPNGSPWEPGCGGGVGWGAAIAVMPWEFYRQYGALDVLEDNYEAMKGYVTYMKTWMTEDGTMFSRREGPNGEPLKWFNLGEWAEPGETVSDEFVHTFYLWYCADICAKTAEALGKPQEARAYAELAGSVSAAFHAKFFNEKAGTYGDGGGNVLALRMGVPGERYDRVVAALRENLGRTDGHIDTGIFGTRFFFEVLAENGMNELAYEAMNKRTEPSFGYQIEQGATTTWEHWSGRSSQNHPMFGGGLVWFYRNLAGMQVDPEQPGYRHIVFKPQPAGDLEFVEYSNMTAFGRAGIRWEREEDGLRVRVTVPVGCTATVHLPTDARRTGESTGTGPRVAAGGITAVTEGGRPVSESPGVTAVSERDGSVVVETEAGAYEFGV